MKYFNLHDILSRNAILNMIIGHRSAGKTYSFKEWSIKDWKKNGKEFMYIRRYKNEIDNVKDTLFDDIADKYNIEVRCIGKKYEARNIPTDEDIENLSDKELRKKYPWKTFGWAIALSQQQMYKSASWPNVNKMCLDEFIIENPRQHYLENEVNQLLSLYFTIDRNRGDVRIILLSNSGFLSNPYFTEYDIKAKDIMKSHWIKRKNGFVVCNYYENEENSKELTNSNLGKISTDKYKDYAINNEFADANNNFVIEKKPKGYSYVITITDGETKLDLYRSTGNNDDVFNTIWVTIGKGNNMLSTNPSMPIENAPYQREYISFLRNLTHKLLVTYQSPEARIAWYDMVKP